MIDGLASAALCGLPIERMIRADAVEWAIWSRVLRAAADQHRADQRDQAIHTANFLGKVLGG